MYEDEECLKSKLNRKICKIKNTWNELYPAKTLLIQSLLALADNVFNQITVKILGSL